MHVLHGRSSRHDPARRPPGLLTPTRAERRPLEERVNRGMSWGRLGGYDWAEAPIESQASPNARGRSLPA